MKPSSLVSLKLPRPKSPIPSWIIHFVLGFAAALLSVIACLSLYSATYGSSSISSYFHSKTSSARLPTIVAFGDSLTQRGYVAEAEGATYTGWVASLSNYMVRRADVVNRGYSGFNTQMSLDLDLVEDQILSLRPSLVIVCFGANDSIDKKAPQYVSIDNYITNFKKIIAQLRKSKKANGADIDIIVLTPPPVYEPDLEASNLKKNKAILRDRINDRTKQYAQACISVAKELRLHYIDLWEQLGGSHDDRRLNLVDGLHFNSRGNNKVFSLIQEHFEAYLPHWSAKALPSAVPPHYSILHVN